MNVKQISVFLDNKSGCLYALTKLFAEKEISIRALTVVDTSDFSMVRIIVDNALWTVNLLKEAGFLASFTDVIAAEVPNTPSGLNNVFNIMREAKINIEYMYTIFSRKSFSRICIVFKLDDNDAAISALKASGIKVLGQCEIAEL
ncbi:MAG: hypothetical protein IJU48_11150 [Synergistaceae bacterium]|nr:hypothetical protein [Synergistaceae bacterium]